MDLTNLDGYDLTGLDRHNIVVGKNGCGTSRLLKTVEQQLRGRAEVGAVRYISPERAGTLSYEANIEQNLASNPNWLADTRRQNQAPQFRQQSAAQFRRLELLVLREIEQNPALRGDTSYGFGQVVDRISSLLDRVYITRGDPSFVIRDRRDHQVVSAGQVSSGESELISLGIECLVFQRECQASRINVLLLDEPDVHLHPDLQARFGRFLNTLVVESPVTIILATHSTAFLGAGPGDSTTRLAFMKYGDQRLQFSPIDYTYRRVLPVFGAHPLSNVFNEAPVLLVEGDDDERIWQQAVRSANGVIRLYPVSVDGVSNLAAFEKEVAHILEAVYDEPVGYSLRDRDDEPGELGDVGPIRRFRLSCRAAENLLLTDDVLVRAGVEWSVLERRLREWSEHNTHHPHAAAVQSFIASGLDRMNADLKPFRNDLVGVMGSNKPWEVLVGQAIADLARDGGASTSHSVRRYLGESAYSVLVNNDASSGGAVEASAR